MRKLGLAAAIALLGQATLACSTSTPTRVVGGNATDAAPPGDSGTSCATDPLGLTYAPNMVQRGASGNLSIELVSVMAPNEQGIMMAGPPVEGDNQWIVRVLDKSGAPVKGAMFPRPSAVPVGCPAVPGVWPVGVYACMPHHGHGTSQPTLTPNADGTYTIDGLYFYMVGLWQVQIDATAAGVSDTATFGFCIDG